MGPEIAYGPSGTPSAEVALRDAAACAGKGRKDTVMSLTSAPDGISACTVVETLDAVSLGTSTMVPGASHEQEKRARGVSH